jgi:hypothetical protein
MTRSIRGRTEQQAAYNDQQAEHEAHLTAAEVERQRAEASRKRAESALKWPEKSLKERKHALTRYRIEGPNAAKQRIADTAKLRIADAIHGINCEQFHWKHRSPWPGAVSGSSCPHGWGLPSAEQLIDKEERAVAAQRRLQQAVHGIGCEILHRQAEPGPGWGSSESGRCPHGYVMPSIEEFLAHPELLT